MRRFLLLILLLIFLLVFFVSIKARNYLFDSDSYDLHTLYFDNLSTNNILDYFSNIEVVKIYPYINPIYKDNIGVFSYEVRGHDLANEIISLKEKYLNIIKKNSYLDYNYLYMNGINISKMDVYISDKDLYDIVNSGLLVHIVK